MRRQAVWSSCEGAKTQSAIVSRRSVNAHPSGAMQACGPVAETQRFAEGQVTDRDESSLRSRTVRLP